MRLKIINYMGEKWVNSEKFKYMCMNMGSYPTAAVSDSISYPSTV
jgi:hypothetical protein